METTLVFKREQITFRDSAAQGVGEAGKQREGGSKEKGEARSATAERHYHSLTEEEMLLLRDNGS